MAPPSAAPMPQDDPQASRNALPDAEFKALLAGVIPHLRAYGRSLSGNPDLADDLTQDTMVKAWASRERFGKGGRAGACRPTERSSAFCRRYPRWYGGL